MPQENLILTKDMISVNPEKHPLMKWFTYSEDDILKMFAELPDSQRIGKDDEQFVFVPGTRKNRVLLVSHVDTVFDSTKTPKPAYYKGHFFSLSKNDGIGADDRAGCAILWELRNSGHSLLLTNGEESGCKGARFAASMPIWKKIINEHQFAIEFDRMNDKDLAFYEVGSTQFKDWCEEQFPGYKRLHGSGTDICRICDPMCGVNISVGYYGQHTANEHLVEEEWLHTLELTKKVLAQENIPRFEYERTNYSYGNGYGYGGCGTGYSGYHQSYANNNDQTSTAIQQAVSSTKKEIISYSQLNIFVCEWCDGVQDKSEFNRNDEKCIFCSKGLMI